MIALILGLIQVFWFVYLFIAIAGVATAVRSQKDETKKLRSGIVTFLWFAVLPAGLAANGFYNEWTMKQRNAVMNAQFTKRCTEDARITIKRVIENVDGVFIMKPRKKATSGDLQDQFWMGDPYGYAAQEVERPQTFLYDSTHSSIGRPRTEVIPGYRYVELPNPAKESDPNASAFVKWTGAEARERGYQKEISTSVQSRESRFGFEWEDISTPEDRKYWIAGGRTRIVDLQTGEVVAERVGYLIDPMQGGRVGGETWLYSNGNACPRFENDWEKTQEFLGQVLKSPKGMGYG